MRNVYLICPLEEERFEKKSFMMMMERIAFVDEISYHPIFLAEDLEPIEGKKILFVVLLDETGVNMEYYRMLQKIRQHGAFFKDCIGAIVVNGANELYTKSLARQLVFTANEAGAMFIGRPLVEGTGSLKNFLVQSKNKGVSLEKSYSLAVRDLLCRMISFRAPKHEKPKLLVVHASHFERSNTRRFWQMVESYLVDFDIKILSLRNGEIQDCSGCPYTMCMHFSEKGQCYYGGSMVEEVYPALDWCDALVVLCPNYNDALSANIVAFINRMTSLFRRHPFFDKYLFGIVVSGYSGSDIVAKQLISALNMNKSFILPSNFAVMETANDPDSIKKIVGIEEQAKKFAEHMESVLKP